MPGSLRFLAVLIPSLLLTLGVYPPVHADKVILKSGEVVEGKIDLDASGLIVIRTAQGVRTIRREDVRKVEKDKTPKDLYKEKAAALRRGDAKGHYELGLWCKEKKLRKEARREFEAVLRLEKDHAEARKELGYVHQDGRWVKEGKAGGKTRPKKAGDDRRRGSGKKKSGEETAAPEAETPPSPEKNREEWKEDWKKRMAEYKGVPLNKAHRIEGNGYILICNSTREVAEWYAKALNKIDRELAYFFRKAPVIRWATERTMVTVYRTQFEFNMQTQVRALGFFRPDSGEIHAFHGVIPYTGNTVSVLGHEYTHKWTAKVVPDHGKMPPWIREGLAVYFADGIVVPREGKAQVRQIPRDRLLVIQRAIREGRYIKIRELMTIPQGPQFTGFHYAHAWSVIYMMVNTTKANENIFNKMFSDCITEKFEVANFEKVCKRIGGIEGFEQRWKEWVLNVKVPSSGTVTDDVFRCDYSNFTLRLPDDTWEFDLGAKDAPRRDLWWYQGSIKKGKARINILSGSNTENLTAKKAVERKEESLEKTNKVLLKGSLDANGYEAHEIYYTSEPPPEKKKTPEEGGKEGEKPKPGDPPDEEKEKPGDLLPKKPPTRMRRVYIATAPHFIILEVSAPTDEFDTVDSSFERVLQSLKIHFE